MNPYATGQPSLCTASKIQLGKVGAPPTQKKKKTLAEPSWKRQLASFCCFIRRFIYLLIFQPRAVSWRGTCTAILGSGQAQHLPAEARRLLWQMLMTLSVHSQVLFREKSMLGSRLSNRSVFLMLIEFSPSQTSSLGPRKGDLLAKECAQLNLIYSP